MRIECIIEVMLCCQRIGALAVHVRKPTLQTGQLLSQLLHFSGLTLNRTGEIGFVMSKRSV